MEVKAIVLAAGKGTRMHTELPKCAHQIIDKAMVEYVVDSLRAAKVEEIITVVGYKKEVLESILARKTKFVYQAEQLGTAHAVLMAEHLLRDFKGTTLIAIGDMPMITSETYSQLIEYHAQTDADLTVLTTNHPEPFGYGRIIRNQNRDIERIVEEKDCTEEQKKITEINSSIYLVDNQKLFASINEIKSNNRQNEYYLTDIVRIFREKGFRISGYTAEDYWEISGANDKYQLMQIENYLQDKIIKKHLLSGVTIHNPRTVVIGIEAEIESGCFILPGSIIVGNSRIKKGAVIGPHTEINNSQIGQGTLVRYSRVKDSDISEDKTVGPFVDVLDNEIINQKFGMRKDFD
jgi:bifunctional UDP-N-acetylglucosamine pyrophosphorylase/glucosamine-1-phosphate N-acetyltransferase